jgi:putative phosphoribosyl transferase
METLMVRVGTPAALEADLTVPDDARGVLLFAHGSGSSRHSPRNRMVAERLRGAGFATMLADLLTVEEERHDATTGALRFDIGLLAHRVVAVVDWLCDQPATARRPLGLFGASTGAAAALAAAAQRPEAVRAVVSRGGRPDLAGESLALVRAPTLLIVGERDEVVARLNRRAAGRLRAVHALQTVAGATHLFEEPGALEQVAGWAAEWFDRHLAGGDLALDGLVGSPPPSPGHGGGGPREGRR